MKFVLRRIALLVPSIFIVATGCHDTAHRYYNRGTNQLSRGNLQSSIHEFNTAIHHHPEYTAAYIKRGIVRRKTGQRTKALQDFNKALSLDPEAKTAYLQRGLIRKEQGELQQAIRDWKQALKVAPADWKKKSDIRKLLRRAKQRKE